VYNVFIEERGVVKMENVMGVKFVMLVGVNEEEGGSWFEESKFDGWRFEFVDGVDDKCKLFGDVKEYKGIVEKFEEYCGNFEVEEEVKCEFNRKLKGYMESGLCEVLYINESEVGFVVVMNSLFEVVVDKVCEKLGECNKEVVRGDIWDNVVIEKDGDKVVYEWIWEGSLNVYKDKEDGYVEWEKLVNSVFDEVGIVSLY
jgi:hypothetical protein